MPPFRLALAQILVVSKDREANLVRAEQAIAEAAEKRADVVLLPEALDLGWTQSTSLAGEIPEGESCRRLIHAAREHNVFVCAGLVERSNGRVFNSAVLISSEGEILIHHRKLNELEIGHEFYGQGDRLQTVDTPWGKWGVMICADAFAPDEVISRALGYMGADVILSPSAWAVPPKHDNTREPYGDLWRDCYGRVAQDFSMWIAGCSCVGKLQEGPWKGWRTIGCSLVISPQGEQVVQGSYGENAEELLLVEITPLKRPARGGGWETLWNEGGFHLSPGNEESRASTPQRYDSD